MRIFAIALLMISATASADSAVIHFRDSIVVSECPHIDYAVFIDESRHLGKVGASNGCKSNVLAVPGMVPDIPESDFSMTVFVRDQLFFECALLHVYESDGEKDIVAACNRNLIVNRKH